MGEEEEVLFFTFVPPLRDSVLEKFNFIKSKYYGRILCKMQKETGNFWRKRGCHERKGRSKEKGDDRDLS